MLTAASGGVGESSASGVRCAIQQSSRSSPPRRVVPRETAYSECRRWLVRESVWFSGWRSVGCPIASHSSRDGCCDHEVPSVHAYAPDASRFRIDDACQSPRYPLWPGTIGDSGWVRKSRSFRGICTRVSREAWLSVPGGRLEVVVRPLLTDRACTRLQVTAFLRPAH